MARDTQTYGPFTFLSMTENNERTSAQNIVIIPSCEWSQIYHKTGGNIYELLSTLVYLGKLTTTPNCLIITIHINENKEIIYATSTIYSLLFK